MRQRNREVVWAVSSMRSMEHTYRSPHLCFREGKKHHLSVLILNKPDHWVLRFRDDCRAFDPVRYAPGAGDEALGIRLVQGIARDAYYTYSMNLNNLVLKLPKETQMPAGKE